MKKYIEPQLTLVSLNTTDIMAASTLIDDPTDPVKAALSSWSGVLGGLEQTGTEM